MALNKKILLIVGGSLLGLAFIFFVVSNAVPIWGRYDVKGSETTGGLWQLCATTTDSKHCVTIECLPNKIYTRNFCDKVLAARAFVTLACIISGISALCLFISAVINDNTQQILLMAAKGLAFASLIMGIIGVAVGIDIAPNIKTEIGIDMKSKWGASAIIGVIAIIINFCGAVVSLLIK